MSLPSSSSTPEPCPTTLVLEWSKFLAAANERMGSKHINQILNYDKTFIVSDQGYPYACYNRTGIEFLALTNEYYSHRAHRIKRYFQPKVYRHLLPVKDYIPFGDWVIISDLNGIELMALMPFPLPSKPFPLLVRTP